MNTQLNKLFEEFKISEKDRYEINQIFLFLSDEKKQRLLNNFKTLAEKVIQIEKDIIFEQEVLLDNLLTDLKSLVK